MNVPFLWSCVCYATGSMPIRHVCSGSYLQPWPLLRSHPQISWSINQTHLSAAFTACWVLKLFVLRILRLFSELLRLNQLTCFLFWCYASYLYIHTTFICKKPVWKHNMLQRKGILQKNVFHLAWVEKCESGGRGSGLHVSGQRCYDAPWIYLLVVMRSGDLVGTGHSPGV